MKRWQGWHAEGWTSSHLITSWRVARAWTYWLVAIISGRPPVVYVTAVTDINVALAAIKAGASDYVPKTVGEEFFELLSNAISQAVEKARLQSERDRAEKEVREARDRAEVLLHEVNHRVANSLALVAAFVALQARAVSDPSVRSALGEIQNRIAAIAGVHRHLYSSKDVRVVEISDYLAILLRDLEATFREAGNASTVRLAAERIEVPTDKAVSIGIVVTELITNAFKYAYPNNQAGEIRVRLKKFDADKATLSVEDDGIGWTGEGTIRGTGAGSSIINDLARGLGSHITYDAVGRGCRASLEFETASGNAGHRPRRAKQNQFPVFTRSVDTLTNLSSAPRADGCIACRLPRFISASEFDDAPQNDWPKGRRQLSSFRRPREAEVLIAGVGAECSHTFSNTRRAGFAGRGTPRRDRRRLAHRRRDSAGSTLWAGCPIA